MQANIKVNGTFEEIQLSNLSFTECIQSLVTPDIESVLDDNDDTDYSVRKKSMIDRTLSTTSDVSLLCDVNENKNQDEQVKNVETRSTGNVSRDIYLLYFLNGGSKIKISYLIFTFILSQIVT